MHPGGLASIQQYAGRDASAPFAASHTQGLLTGSPHDSLRIGRMVDEISVDQLQLHHVALDKWVYDITGNKAPLFFSFVSLLLASVTTFTAETRI